MKSLFLLVVIFVSFSFFGKNSKAKTHSDSLDVLNYDINLRITDFAGKTIQGYTQVTVKPKFNGLSKVKLDLLVFSIDSIVWNNQLVSLYEYNDTLLTITPIQSFTTLDTAKIKIYYHGFPQEDPGVDHWGGFKWVGNSAFNLGVGFAAEPHNFGRCWFPCVDDFVERATYDYHITVDSTLNHMAVCGGMLQSVINNGNGTRTCSWKQIEEIPTYLASVAVSNYVCVSDTFQAILGPTPVDIWVTPAETSLVWNSFPKLEEVFHIFENKFGPYRWQRVGYVSVNYNSGAMEHASNISYPKFVIGGNNNYESLYAHELFHHWFGNLITCNMANEMWINEGWARYSETIYQEELYGVDYIKPSRRTLHKENLRYNHIEEGAHYAVNSVPSEFTYGSTSYDKGSDVVHSLRHHFGDDIFYPAVKQFLDSMAFKDVTSHQLLSVIGHFAGSNLDGFYESWVNSPGYPHFSVDSFFVVPNGLEFDITVYFREKLRARTNYSSNVNFEVNFMNNQWQRFDAKVNFTGPIHSQTFTVPFNPVIVVVDIDEKTADATTDLYKTIKTTATNDFPTTYFAAFVNQVTDSAFLRVEHNWVAPDTLITPLPGIFISKERYWKIDGILPQDFSMQGKFYYNKTQTSTGYLDIELITNHVDSLVLFYRPNLAIDWQIIPTTRIGSIVAGNLIASNIQPGLYALGIRDWDKYTGLHNTLNQKSTYSIYPNPANDNIIIRFDNLFSGYIRIYDSSSRLFYLNEISDSVSELKIDIQYLKSGIYTVVMRDDKGNVSSKKVVIE